MIRKEFEAPSGTFALLPCKEYITIIQISNDFCSNSIDWDNLTNMEMVAEACGEMKVKDFIVVAEELGKMYNKRSVYMDLL